MKQVCVCVCVFEKANSSSDPFERVRERDLIIDGKLSEQTKEKSKLPSLCVPLSLSSHVKSLF